MFGFNSNKNNEEAKVVADDGYNGRRDIIEIRIAETFGTCDPQKIDKILREFMPEVTNAILNTEDAAVKSCISLVNVNENINIKHDEMMEELKSLRLQNKELQEKYNALVERMAGYIERENGKGR